MTLLYSERDVRDVVTYQVTKRWDLRDIEEVLAMEGLTRADIAAIQAEAESFGYNAEDVADEMRQRADEVRRAYTTGISLEKHVTILSSDRFTVASPAYVAAREAELRKRGAEGPIIMLPAGYVAMSPAYRLYALRGPEPGEDRG